MNFLARAAGSLIKPALGSLLGWGASKLASTGVGQWIGKQVGKALPYLKSIGQTVHDILPSDYQKAVRTNFGKIGAWADEKINKPFYIKENESHV